MTALNVNVYDHLGRPVQLGVKLGTGGEGSVFDIVNSPSLVAKVYHKAPPAQRAAKLRTMVGLARKELCAVAAWPTATLHDRPGGSVCGLVMQKVKNFQEVHTLYSPAHRKTAYPHADWRFLVHVARNCAAAFDAVHGCGAVMGDVNQSNVLVSQNGMVALIDCDSFQVQLNGQTYPCEVGVPLFTPPELQGTSFRGVLRTANHDRFGLAVLIFHLLFMGRHPFSGRFQGRGDMPIERAIAEHRFAYGAAARSVQMLPPLHALTLAAVSPQLGNLFERAFGRNSAQPNARPAASEWHAALSTFQGALRNCPADVGHLFAPHLATCPWCDLMKHGAPNFFIAVAYTRAIAPLPGAAFDLVATWARIERVPRPAAAYARPAAPPAPGPTPWPSNLPRALPPRPVAPTILTAPPAPPPLNLPPPKHHKVKVLADSAQQIAGVSTVASCVGFGLLCLWAKVFGVAAIIALLAFGAWWLMLERGRRREEHAANREYEEEAAQRRAAIRRHQEEWMRNLAAVQSDARRRHDAETSAWGGITAALRAEAERRRKAAEEARQRVAAAEQHWATTSSRLAGDFDRKKGELQKLKDRYHELLRGFTAERQQLQARAREMQLNLYLQQQFISDHKIDDIGETLTATLASWGIETAFDVEENSVDDVPGFGPKRTKRLMQWRRAVESQFVFDLKAGVPKQEQQRLEVKYAQARQQIETDLRKGERALSGLSARATDELRQLYDQIRACISRLNQAQADLATIPPGA